MTLHEAMASVLIKRPNKTASFKEIAAEIAKRDLYSKRNGGYPSETQIRARANKYPNLFKKRLPGKVQLK